jgi:hypothetical protein
MIQTTSQIRQEYSKHTDVLRVGWGSAPADVTDDTPSGFIVHYAMPQREPVGVEILRYCRRYGSKGKTLHIDAEPPFDLDVQAVECDRDLCDARDFDPALRVSRRR